jgi:predicted DNA-binding helix-hairpin-helix protein
VEVNKKGIYFAFRDEGACISLLAIKVSPHGHQEVI